jgi:hypothetical protein
MHLQYAKAFPTLAVWMVSRPPTCGSQVNKRDPFQAGTGGVWIDAGDRATALDDRTAEQQQYQVLKGTPAGQFGPVDAPGSAF